MSLERREEDRWERERERFPQQEGEWRGARIPGATRFMVLPLGSVPLLPSLKVCGQNSSSLDLGGVA